MPEILDVSPAPLASRSERVAGWLRTAAPALLAYAAVRLVGLAILWVAAAAEGADAHHLLTRRWDSVWYVRVAEQGYGFEVVLPDGGVHSSLAFFPLLPALERGLAALGPLAAADAGLLVGWLASLAAAAGIFAVGARIGGPRVGVLLAALWGAHPTAFVQSMAYTETLFTALAAWALYAVLTERWVTAGALAVLAGLSRPSAAALVAALVVTAGAHWLGELRRGTPAGELLRRRPRMLAGVLLAPLGWLSYVLYVAVRTGRPWGYFEVQAQWGNGFDGGVALAAFVWENLRAHWPAGLGLCAALALVGWLVVLCVRQRQPLPLLVYGVVIVVVSLVGSGYFGSRPRLMMPAFTLLLPAALALARLRPTRSAAVCLVAAVASGGYGAFTLLGSGPP